jgi:glucosamine--fructose-6-phosphate aminotransferase (isomerizing)
MPESNAPAEEGNQTMCGIVGYVGDKEVVGIILDGLRKLEYRGYDSAGIAVVDDDGNLIIRRAEGKLRNLEEAIRLNPLKGKYGIGHTRWATHGRPTEENAHPHRDCTGKVVVVHNGIIENYLSLKQRLQAEDHRLVTETDTEVVAHLIEKFLREGAPNLESAVRRTVSELRGICAMAVLWSEEPEKIVAVRQGPPIVIGLGENEYFVASDVPPVLEHTREVFFLGDGEIATLTRGGVTVTDFEGTVVAPRVQHITWDPIMVEKGGFKHYMLKEIYEQPRAVRDTVIGRVSQTDGRVFLEEMELSDEDFRRFTSVKAVACGTSHHAAMAGKYMLEQLVRIPVEVDYASEFRYRDPILDENTLVVAISQSGETADTLAAVRESREKGAKILSICNVQGSMLTRESHGTILTHAGPEIGVASTKAFTSQMTVFYLLALYMAQRRGVMSQEESLEHVRALSSLPVKMESLLSSDEQMEKLAREFHKANGFLYLGRGINFPIALEGALKLKEISYIHAEGYPAGEMKHGPNALIDEELPVVVIATRDASNPASNIRYEKTLSNMQEVKARDGVVIALVTEGDAEANQAADRIIEIPHSTDLISPILAIVPLQLLAYHIGVRRGCDVDQPRNLAKSVTVE